MMIFLTTHFDAVLEQNYDLYLMKPKELKVRIMESYGKKISDIEKNIHLFNRDIELFEKQLYLNQLNQDRAENRAYPTGNKLEIVNIDGKQITLEMPSVAQDTFQITTEEMKDVTKKINEKDFINDEVNLAAKMGYELMPIAVSIKNKDMNIKEYDIELLDGFRRMFYTNELPENEVLVKVYDTLNDRDWINAMILYNSWKFAGNKTSNTYLDRGFRLGLFYRYGYDFTDLGLFEYDYPFSVIASYVNKKPYETFYNNEQTHNDLVLIMEIMNARPSFEKIKYKKIEEVRTVLKNHGRSYSLQIMHDVFVREIGNFRREEWQLEQIDGKVKRKQFTNELIRSFYARNDLQKHFVKLLDMEIEGHIRNYIYRYLLDSLRLHIRE